MKNPKNKTLSTNVIFQSLTGEGNHREGWQHQSDDEDVAGTEQVHQQPPQQLANTVANHLATQYQTCQHQQKTHYAHHYLHSHFQYDFMTLVVDLGLPTFLWGSWRSYCMTNTQAAMTNTQAAMTNTQAASQSPVFFQHRTGTTDVTKGKNVLGCSKIKVRQVARTNITVCIGVCMMHSDCTWVTVLFHGLNHQASDICLEFTDSQSVKSPYSIWIQNPVTSLFRHTILHTYIAHWSENRLMYMSRCMCVCVWYELLHRVFVRSAKWFALYKTKCGSLLLLLTHWSDDKSVFLTDKHVTLESFRLLPCWPLLCQTIK